jgi:hypothetical protein
MICPDLKVLSSVLKPRFTHPVLTQMGLWLSLIHAFDPDDYKQIGKWFRANSLDIGESSVKLLMHQRSLEVCVWAFLRRGFVSQITERSIYCITDRKFIETDRSTTAVSFLALIL